MVTKRLRRHICARSGLEDALVDAIVCAWRECAADTFVAVEHVGERSSIRFGLVACECDDGTCSLGVRECEIFVPRGNGCVEVGGARKRWRKLGLSDVRLKGGSRSRSVLLFPPT
jgi:hypothetical protein